MNKKTQQKISKLSIAAVLVAGSISANAFEIENNGWTFSLHGNVNAFYMYNHCDSSTATVNGAFLCGGATEDQNGISNGYLPTTFQFGLATTKAGYDVTVNAAYDRGLDTDQAFNVNSNGDDDGFRIWMTVGNDDMGTVTLGRDWGLFAYDATFQDMSVSGVGGGLSVSNPFNTQLGAAGTGYIFLDRITGMTWTLPTSESLVAQIGVFQSFNLSSFSGTSGSFAGAETGAEEPGIQGRLRYNFGNGFISSSFFRQDVEATAGAATASYTAFSYDVTGQLSLDNLALTASYFDANGVGQTGLLIDAVDPFGTERDSDGYYVQATYTLGSTRLGLNYGVSNLDTTTADVGTTLEKKTKLTVGVYHTLASDITVVGEYSQVEAENKASDKLQNDLFSVGAIYFF